MFLGEHDDWKQALFGKKNESSLEPEWGAGIDTPKYSGIRKMSEVVVRVNNAWAK